MKLWIARDKDGQLWLYTLRPEKDLENGIWHSLEHNMAFLANGDEFPFINWEDDQPAEIEFSMYALDKEMQKGLVTYYGLESTMNHKRK